MFQLSLKYSYSLVYGQLKKLKLKFTHTQQFWKQTWCVLWFLQLIGSQGKKKVNNFLGGAGITTNNTAWKH